jgi:hypothetical protein
MFDRETYEKFIKLDSERYHLYENLREQVLPLIRKYVYVMDGDSRYPSYLNAYSIEFNCDRVNYTTHRCGEDGDHYVLLSTLMDEQKLAELDQKCRELTKKLEDRREVARQKEKEELLKRLEQLG